MLELAWGLGKHGPGCSPPSALPSLTHVPLGCPRCVCLSVLLWAALRQMMVWRSSWLCLPPGRAVPARLEKGGARLGAAGYRAAGSALPSPRLQSWAWHQGATSRWVLSPNPP